MFCLDLILFIEISLEDATFLAREMLSFNEDVLISFGKQFDTDVVLVDYKSFTWAYVMAVLTKWMKTNHKATKADLARKILALSSVSKTTKDAADLKKLARQLFQRGMSIKVLRNKLYSLYISYKRN